MKRFSFPARQFFLLTFTGVAAGIRSSPKFWNSNAEAVEKANVRKREAAAQGLKPSHILPVVTQQKEQHSAGDKWEESVLLV